MKKLFALSCVLASTAIFAEVSCTSEPVPCNQESCACIHCLGPANLQGNAPVRPWTCDGDVQLSASAIYWKASQDGMEYGYKNNTKLSPEGDIALIIGTLVDAEYLTPTNQYEFGYKLGLSYFSPCDGWEVGIHWTNFKGTASSHEQIPLDKGTVAIPGGTLTDVPNAPDGAHLEILWSAFSGVFGQKYLFCGSVDTAWEVPISLLDFELAREFWVSKRLSFRPMIGVRLGQISQKYLFDFKGGVWSSSNMVFSSPEVTITDQPAYHGNTILRNDFQGIGPMGGVSLNWNFSCGWSLYSDLALSILYGHFNVRNHETFREAESPFSKSDAIDIDESFKASRGILDLDLGIQWSSLICDCKYGVTAQLGWESHLFFHQNQMWRVKRWGGSGVIDTPPTTYPDNFGENIHYQRRGTLSTQGLTFTFKFDF